MYTCIHSLTCIHGFVRKYISILSIDTILYTYTYVCIYIHICCWCVCVCVCVHVCVCACIYKNRYIHT